MVIWSWLCCKLILFPVSLLLPPLFPPRPDPPVLRCCAVDVVMVIGILWCMRCAFDHVELEGFPANTEC